MQTDRDRLSDIRRRITDAERRLVELQSRAVDDGMTAVLIENVAATLTLLREHAARLESRLAPERASENRR